MIFVQPGQNLVQDLQLFLVDACVDQKVIDVYQDVFDVT